LFVGVVDASPLELFTTTFANNIIIAIAKTQYPAICDPQAGDPDVKKVMIKQPIAETANIQYIAKAIFVVSIN
jgi:hypothetical protein